jgi:hypothetical protein
VPAIISHRADKARKDAAAAGYSRGVIDANDEIGASTRKRRFDMRQRMSRKSGYRFSDQDMRRINESRAHPIRPNRDAL